MENATDDGQLKAPAEPVELPVHHPITSFTVDSEQNDRGQHEHAGYAVQDSCDEDILR